MTKISIYDATTIARLRKLVTDCPTWLEARAKLVADLKIHPDNATRMNRRHALWGQRAGEAPDAAETFDASVETSDARTLEEVVKLCKVDTDKWEAKGFSVVKRQKGFGWSARFSKKATPVDETALVQFLAKEAAKHAPKRWVFDKPAGKERDCLYILNVQDLHLAKLAWSPETGGADWDIRIAEQAYHQAVDDLMAKAPAARIEEVLVIIGSDMLQVDNDQSTTTAGTYVDSDSRLAKVFEVASKMMVKTIERLASRFKVRAVVVQGNHDRVMSLLLGHYISAWFREHPNVTIDNAPTSRKYVGYGQTLIGFDHGSDIKLAELPLLMMRENQATISRYRYQEILTGDKHHESVKEYKGVKVRIAPALCPPDKWHASHGFSESLRQSQGLLYQRDHGLEAIFYSTPLD